MSEILQLAEINASSEPVETSRLSGEFLYHSVIQGALLRPPHKPYSFCGRDHNERMARSLLTLWNTAHRLHDGENDSL